MTYTRRTQAPAPITPDPLLQGMHIEDPTPTRFPTRSIQGPSATIDLDYHDTNVHGFIGLDSAHQHSPEGSCGLENSSIMQVAPRSENNGEANAEKKTHDSVQYQKKIHSLEATAEDSIQNDSTSRPPKPKPTIANHVRRISCNLMPKKGALKRILSWVPSWLSHRHHKQEKKCEPAVTSNDAGGGKMKRK